MSLLSERVSPLLFKGFIIYLLLFTLNLSAQGESNPATTPSQGEIEELKQRQEILEEEIFELKMRMFYTAATVSVLGLAPGASKVYQVRQGVSLGGYGEILYQAVPGRSNTLDFLRFITYIGYRFDPNFLFNSEVELEHAKVGEGSPGEVALEFAYLEYLAWENLRVRAGLLLVPMGFLNEMHEPTLFLGARRTRSETLVIPTTFREGGVGFVGDAGMVTYKLYILSGLNGNEFSGGTGFRKGRQNGSKALANRFMGVGNLSLTPRSWLMMEGSLLYGNTNQDQGDLPPLNLLIAEVHAEVRYGGLWLRGLLTSSSFPKAQELNEAQVKKGLSGVAPARVTEETARLKREGIGTRPWGGYLEAGYDLLVPLGSSMSLIPYLRWERVDTQAALPQGMERNPSYRKTILSSGVNFKPIPQLVLKGEVEWEGDLKEKPGKEKPSYFLNLGYFF